MNECVLITGGAGFIGSHLAAELLHFGYRVRAFDRLAPQVHGVAASWPTYLAREVERVQGSLLDPHAVRRALRGCSAVVHLAAVVGVGQSMYEIAHYASNNLQGTAELLQAILALNRAPRTRSRGPTIARLLLAGSMSVYGEGRYRCPVCQADWDAVRRSREQLESHLWDPRCPDCGATLRPQPTPENKQAALHSFYALSKQVQEDMALLFGRTYRLPTLALRLFNVYGPHQALANPYTGAVAIFAARLRAGLAPLLFEDGAQQRDFVHVSDVARAFRLALQRPDVSDTALNIASGVPVRLTTLATALAAALGTPRAPVCSGRYRVGDIRHCISDIGQARTQLGYAPQMTLTSGLAQLAAWLQPIPVVPRRTLQRAATELVSYGLTG
ncbi:MAG: NAD-dependent epimerase/dehydratase family protein [Terriglobales bacterium]